MNPAQILSAVFPAEWAQGAMALTLFGTFVVIGVFAYLNWFTQKTYFRLWTVAWLFYAIHQAASLGLENLPFHDFLTMIRCASIGISALFLFWGNLDLTGRPRPQRELVGGSVLMIVWSYVAAYRVQDPLWIQVPVFSLLAAASAYAGWLYRRGPANPCGTSILTVGFLCWSVYLLAFPWLEVWPSLTVVGHVASAIVALYVAMGMVVRVLQEERERHDHLLGELQQGMVRRRLLEQEVAVSEEKYRALFDSASDAIFLVDLDSFEVREANPSAYRLVGWSADELAGRSFLELCPHLSPNGTVLVDPKKLFDTLSRSSFEFAMVQKGGRRVTCEGDANLVPFRGRPVLQINVREITGRKRMEQQLRQAEKLSAVGQLVAGVAHELNNPLAVIMGYAQILSEQRSMEEKTRSEISKIYHESERAAKIVQNLLTFARPCEPNLVVVDVNRLLLRVLEIRAVEFRAAGVQLRICLEPGLPLTKADPNQLEQVLANLVANAVHSMADKEGDRFLDVTTEQNASHIWITVADQGHGIAPEALSKIFEPFFTTKAPGKGTGLGLAICHSILKAHHGKMWVDSQVDQGSKFSIELPILPCEGETVQPAIASTGARPPRSAGRGYRLLIVDDEPGIVEVLETILTANGYAVDTASNGSDALQRITRGHYDLVITDMRMPEMDGETLYQSVREMNPKLARRVIFLTGDTVSATTRSFLERTGNRWFSKPFNIGDIERIVADLLQNEPAYPDAGGQPDRTPVAVRR